MPLRTDAGKALRQIERRDPQGAQQYRAELKYFHVPQRHILGFTNAYEILDEAFTLTPSQMATLDTLTVDGKSVLRQAAAHGPEFVRRICQIHGTLQSMAQTVAKAVAQGQQGYALAPPIEDTPTPDPTPHTPHALPPT